MSIPVRFRRRNGRRMVLTSGEDASPSRDRESHNALVVSLAKAYRWQDELESGKYTSLEDLAMANKVDRTEVGRILRLTSLAPDLVEAILPGDMPEGMSLRRLLKGIPLLWSEQREMWGLNTVRSTQG